MTIWIDRDTALARLGIKPQTLYAYASRRRIRVRIDPADSRRSLYSADDIAEVSVRKARGRKPAAIAASSLDWGEPAIPTSLSTVYRGVLVYRGQNVMELARSATLEQVAELLWGTFAKPDFSAKVTEVEPSRETSVEAWAEPFGLLAALASRGQPITGRSTDHLAMEAASIVGQIATACGAAVGDEPLDQRLALGWGLDTSVADRLRQALVAMADHDLNASTFAARVAASTGASLAACLLAGLSTLSGPRHGGAGKGLQLLLADAHQHGADQAIRRWLEHERMLPGFGHNLYPAGDPRAALILTGTTLTPEMQALADSVRDVTGLLPNCDFALAAMTDALGLPQDTPFRIFLLGRSVGWCAHIMEQNRIGTLIRPRGRYEGQLP
jgi:citrate synthase